MATVSVNVTKQMMAESGTGYANPGDLHIPIGSWRDSLGAPYDGWKGRATLYAPVSFTGMAGITEARLYLRAQVWSHANGTSTATLRALRKTADWNETSHGGSSAVDELWGTDGRPVVNDNLASFVTGDDAALGNIVDDTWYYITITGIVTAWFDGSPNYGLMLYNYTSETSDSYAKEFLSRHVAGSIPYIWIDYTTNTTPGAPTGLSPTGDAVVNTGRTITYQGTRSDADSGDYITAYQIRVYKDDGTTLVQDSGEVTTTGTPTTFSKSLTFPTGYNADAYYKWKARTRDQASAWGAYSSLQRFRPNTVPNTPSAPTVPTNNLTPSISGGFSDPDNTGVSHTGDDLAAVQIQVVRTSDSVTMWDSGDLAATGSTWAKTYAGSALSWAVQYKARCRTKDALGGYSSWSAYTTWTTVQPTGPDACTPDSVATKQNSLTPTLTIGHSAQFRNDQIQVRTTPGGGTLLWDHPKDGSDYANTSSKGHTYAGSALSWGGTYYWRALVELTTGADTAWSDWLPFYINAQPTGPVLTFETDAGVPAIAGDAGVWIVTDSTPVIRCPFADPDLAPYGDTASARRIEIRRKSDQVALTGYPDTAGTTDSHTVTNAMTVDTVYEVRVGFRDAAGEPAGSYAYSSWYDLKYATAPSAALVAPTEASTITLSAATLDWSFTGTGGKTQRTYRVLVYDKGPTGANWTDPALVYDSGVVTSTATAVVLPAGLLADDHDFAWNVVVTDTDNLSYTL